MVIAEGIDKKLIEEVKIKSIKMPVEEAEYALRDTNPLDLYNCIVPRLKE